MHSACEPCITSINTQKQEALTVALLSTLSVFHNLQTPQQAGKTSGSGSRSHSRRCCCSSCTTGMQTRAAVRQPLLPYPGSLP